MKTVAAEGELVTADTVSCNARYRRNWSRDGESWPRDNGNRINMVNAGPGLPKVGLGMAKPKSIRLIAEEKSHNAISKIQTKS